MDEYEEEFIFDDSDKELREILMRAEADMENDGDDDFSN